MYKYSNSIKCLVVTVQKKGETLNAECEKLNHTLNISCGILCTVNKNTYLYVNPNVLWLSEDMFSNAEFNVISNTSWEISY